MTKPQIQVSNDLRAMTDAAIEALADDSDVYQRAGRLVHVVRSTGEPGAVVRCEGSPIIKSMERPTLLERLAAAADWVRYDARREALVGTRPPTDIVSAVAARGQWAKVRPLVGVLEAPALRPDGTVIQTAGYDVPTGHLYMPSATFPEVPAHPTRADAHRACAELLEVACDFPFASEPHRSAWLALALTLFARPAIAGCVPLAAVDATTRGTGKGKLTDATAILFTGRDASKTPQPQDDEEMRKRITALILEGESIAVIDNVTRPLGDASLDAAVTSTQWKDRSLGKNETISAPNRIVWIVTANNLQFGGDTARRTLHIRLESPLENPEDRSDFRHVDLLGWVRVERPRLVVCALTVLRAYFDAGCPNVGVRAWGSFEDWSRIVASAIKWAGFADPQTTRIELEAAADTGKNALAAMLAGLARLMADTPTGQTAKAIVAALYPADRHGDGAAPDGYDDLRDAIEELAPPTPSKPPSPTKLGQVLRNARRRVIGGRMVDGAAGHGGILRWRVVAARGVGGNGGPVAYSKGQDVLESYRGEKDQTVPIVPTGDDIDQVAQ